MRIQHVARAAKGWPDATPGDRTEAAALADTIEHIRWRLWYGQVQRALNLIGYTLVLLDAAAETASPHAATAGKVSGVLRGLETYVSGQSSLRVRDLLRISVHAARWKVCILLVS